jgi:hypothetical protein
MLLPSFECSSLQIHESDRVFKDLTDAQVYSHKEGRQGDKSRKNFFLGCPLYISVLCPLLHTWNDLPLRKLAYCCLACPYILKSPGAVRTYDFQFTYVYFIKWTNVTGFLLFLSESNMSTMGNFVLCCSFCRDMYKDI